MRGQKRLFVTRKALDKFTGPEKSGLFFNEWLNENIPNMKPNRYINIWKKMNQIARSEEDLLKLQNYVVTKCKNQDIYNYYFVMYLLDTLR